MKKALAAMAAVVVTSCSADAPREVSMVQQQVNGANWLNAQNATAAGEYAALDAGGQAGGLWAWAKYTAPVTPHELPSEVNIYLADLTGSYYIGLYDWPTNRWNYSGPFTALSVTLPTTSAFWTVHVYGSDKVTVLESAFETAP